jgi:hypothetical protein
LIEPHAEQGPRRVLFRRILSPSWNSHSHFKTNLQASKTIMSTGTTLCRIDIPSSAEIIASNSLSSWRKLSLHRMVGIFLSAVCFAWECFREKVKCALICVSENARSSSFLTRPPSSFAFAAATLGPAAHEVHLGEKLYIDISTNHTRRLPGKITIIVTITHAALGFAAGSPYNRIG